jgi:hypothetical protein
MGPHLWSGAMLTQTMLIDGLAIDFSHNVVKPTLFCLWLAALTDEHSFLPGLK